MLQYRLKSEASIRNDFGRLRNNGTEKNDKEEGMHRPGAACVMPGRSRWKSHQSVEDGIVLCQG
jgi:hypothetical protein